LGADEAYRTEAEEILPMRCSAVIIGLLISLTLWCRTALSDTREEILTRAVVAKELALDQPDRTNWQDAYVRFLEADALEASSDVKYELGFIAAQLNQDDLAVSYYEDALGLGLDGPARDKAVAFVSRLGPVMARLQVRGDNGIRVRIGGIERGTLPLPRPIVILPGATQLEIIDTNRSLVTVRPLSLVAGKTETLDLTVAANATTSSSAPASLPPRSLTAYDAAPTQTRQVAGRWLLGAGVVLTLASAAIVPLSTWKIGQKRDQLAEVCDSPSNDPNGCQAAKAGHYDEARGLAGDIADWRTVRALGWTGLGIGAASAAVGLVMITSKSTDSGRVGRMVVAPTIVQRSLVVNWHFAF
jgi:hypothetical protein